MNHTISNYIKTLVLALLAVGTFSCYPGSITVEESDIVTTDFDAVYFGGNSPKTYFMPDTIGVLGEATEEAQLDRDEMDFILGLVAQNFEELKYERLETIDENNLPDVVVLASALIVNVKGAGCIPWYPGWGWGPWYPGWGWGPGWCYPTYLYSYDTGSLVIDMISPIAPANSDEELNRVWNAGLNGILRGNVQGNKQFIEDGINKAFEVSPYLAPE